MVDKDVVESDAFYDLPKSSQALYFHIAVSADENGNVSSPRTIMRVLGAAADDLKILVAKGFLEEVEGGVHVTA